MQIAFLIFSLHMALMVASCHRFFLTKMRNQFYYRRNLPHWIPRGVSIFLTFRLFGSLPRSCVEELKRLKARLESIQPPPNLDPIEWKLQKRKRLFGAYDSMLDKASTGPTWLRRPDIAKVVQTALLTKYAALYTLWSYTGMPNHFHALLRPKTLVADPRADPVPLENITKRLKGYTAREANRILGRTGTSFWQDESFDHWIRNPQEFERVVAYIENNPVKAGLVARPEDWEWSSAAERKRRNWKELKPLT